MSLSLICSSSDPVSSSIFQILKNKINFKKQNSDNIPNIKYNYYAFIKNNCRIDLYEFSKKLIETEFLNLLKTDLIIFISQHKSKQNINIFSVHALGNWSNAAEFGGKPNQLSISSPLNMFKILSLLKINNNTDIEVVYEASHHGPLLNIPSFFVEFGGNPDSLTDLKYINVLAKSIIDFINYYITKGNTIQNNKEGSKPISIALGIGGSHYASKFTKLAFSKNYAFSHIMPKYYIGNISMLDQAISRSIPKPNIAVIEWKSLNSFQRNELMKKLNELGIDYEKI